MNGLHRNTSLILAVIMLVIAIPFVEIVHAEGNKAKIKSIELNVQYENGFEEVKSAEVIINGNSLEEVKDKKLLINQEGSKDYLEIKGKILDQKLIFNLLDKESNIEIDKIVTLKFKDEEFEVKNLLKSKVTGIIPEDGLLFLDKKNTQKKDIFIEGKGFTIDNSSLKGKNKMDLEYIESGVKTETKEIDDYNFTITQNSKKDDIDIKVKRIYNNLIRSRNKLEEIPKLESENQIADISDNKTIVFKNKNNESINLDLKDKVSIFVLSNKNELPNEFNMVDETTIEINNSQTPGKAGIIKFEIPKKLNKSGIYHILMTNKVDKNELDKIKSENLTDLSFSFVHENDKVKLDILTPDEGVEGIQARLKGKNIISLSKNLYKKFEENPEIKVGDDGRLEVKYTGGKFLGEDIEFIEKEIQVIIGDSLVREYDKNPYEEDGFDYVSLIIPEGIGIKDVKINIKTIVGFTDGTKIIGQRHDFYGESSKIKNGFEYLKEDQKLKPKINRIEPKEIELNKDSKTKENIKMIITGENFVITEDGKRPTVSIDGISGSDIKNLKFYKDKEEIGETGGIADEVRFSIGKDVVIDKTKIKEKNISLVITNPNNLGKASHNIKVNIDKDTDTGEDGEEELLPKTTKLYEGSVVENYDVEYPIVIEGENFDRGTYVDFRAGDRTRYPAYRVRCIDVTDNLQRLIIHLPRGRDKLPVGQYSIIITNRDRQRAEMEYGSFTVVPEGEFIPDPKYLLQYKSLYGPVDALQEFSKNILYLDKTNAIEMTIDLDQTMGENTLTRVIEYPTHHYEAIDLLNLESDWANMKIRNLQLSQVFNSKMIKLRTGRVEPFIYKMVKDQVTSSVVKSEMIEIRGENFDFSEVEIEIPYKDSADGQNLRMVRYDETMGNFVNVTERTDKVNKKVIGRSKEPGIFLVVE